jgi:Ca-activated chloride channel family protein
MKKYISSLLLLFTVLQGMAQVFPVKGTVVFAEGGKAAFVSVTEKGTSNSVVTNKNGEFQIKVTNSRAVLVVSVLGREICEEYVTLNKPMLLVLKKDISLREKEKMAEEELQNRQKLQQYLVKTTTAGAVRGNTTTMAAMPIHESTIGIGYPPAYNREGYDRINETGFRLVSDQPLSTFSVDVDAASYSNIRRFIQQQSLPPDGAVRIEEMINYFSYDYEQPKGKDPVAIHTELSACPWNKNTQLLLVGVQGKKVDLSKLPASNLVFLVDVSGSMAVPNKLPLVKSSLHMLVNQLRTEDRVSIVTYAGNVRELLSAVSGNQKEQIRKAIDQLEAGGGTAGGQGIQLAYKVAREHFMKAGNNRVILCTDGDFNVGVSSDDALERLIEQERGSGVFLSVMGFGMGNYQDAKMQKLATKGNGNHAYIDDQFEAKRVFVNEFGGTLFTIAKDVKLQLEFNPQHIKGYRLIGYVNRRLENGDFNDDKKDAGEMGSGHTVTALYELVMSDAEMPDGIKTDTLKYQSNKKNLTRQPLSMEMVNIKLRYKEPDGEESKKIERVVMVKELSKHTSNNMRFATAVASFGLILSHSAHKGSATIDMVLDLARNALGDDRDGYRREFVGLVEKAGELMIKEKTAERE